jgi:hypothetical protein
VESADSILDVDILSPFLALKKGRLECSSLPKGAGKEAGALYCR